MARPSVVLVTALRKTAARLAGSAAYAWGHHGQCNCGHLVQTLCALPPARIHEIALEGDGDWESLANAYCPTSGHAIDDLLTALVDADPFAHECGQIVHESDLTRAFRIQNTCARFCIWNT